MSHVKRMSNDGKEYFCILCRRKNFMSILMSNFILSFQNIQKIQCCQCCQCRQCQCLQCLASQSVNAKLSSHPIISSGYFTHAVTTVHFLTPAWVSSSQRQAWRTTRRLGTASRTQEARLEFPPAVGPDSVIASCGREWPAQRGHSSLASWA